MSLFQAFASRLTYANVVSTLALVGLLSGGAYAAGTITSKQIKDNTILSRDIHNGTINSKDIKDGSIQAADLGIDAVGTQEIANGSVGADDLANNSVYGGTVADGSLTGADIADGSVGAADLAPGAAHVPIVALLNVGQSKAFVLDGFTFTVSCDNASTKVELSTAVAGSNFTEEQFYREVKTSGTNAYHYGETSIGTSQLGFNAQLVDGDFTRYTLTGINPPSSGESKAVWATVQATYYSATCSFAGVMLSASGNPIP